MQDAIPIYRPDLSGNERRYVLECLDTGWISSVGGFVGRFEQALAQATMAAHAVTVCNGTVALHLALHCLDIGPGDEVIVPTFTYIAPVNTIAQTGATPVFADCRREDWLLDPADVARRITTRTKALLPVHLYGMVCDMPEMRRLADRHSLRIVEDTAEALGSTLEGQHAGTFGDIGTFSFFGNKTVTTGEGGAVITNDDALARRLRIVKGQGMSPERRYWHIEIGFNYRMTNVAAAIGLAQLERLDAILARKQEIAAIYRTLLVPMGLEFQRPSAGVRGSNWLVSVLLPAGIERDRVMVDMAAEGVETRPIFYCAHKMPMYSSGAGVFPVAEEIAARGISLPSYPALIDRDLEHVVSALCAALAKQGLSLNARSQKS
jgi:perosamine synthetase